MSQDRQSDTHTDTDTATAASCFVSRGEARLHAIALKYAVRRHGLDVNTVTAATLLAAQVHRQQRRELDGSPFLCHPLQAATLVCCWGGSTDDVVTAMLHDAAEDHLGGPSEMLGHIQDLFGPAISQRVAALTKNTTLPDRKARELDLMQRLNQAVQTFGPGLAAVRLADRLHNLVTTSHLLPAERLRLHASTLACSVPLADSLGLDALAGFMVAGPAAWLCAPHDGFVSQMLALQGPWLGGSVPPRGSVPVHQVQRSEL